MENSTTDDDDRCARSGYRGWRCSFPRSGGSRYCEKHRAYYLLRNSKSRVRVSTEAAPRASNSSSTSEMKKKLERPTKMKKIEDNFDSMVSDSSNMKSGEIWAFSEESDGIPRFYARIDHIAAAQSLVRVTPLIPHPITDEEKMFAEQGLPSACGVFKHSDSTVIKDISAFRHRVSFEIEGEECSLFKIFPKKGEIWAVYLNSCGDLNKKFEYRLVEVGSDFSEGDGLKVFGLAQVAGMDRVYRRHEHEGFYMVRSFSRGFMPMFSHRVIASRIVEGDEVLWKLV